MESFSAMYCVSKSLFGATSGSEDSSFLQEERKEILMLKKRIIKKFFLDIFFENIGKIQFS